ncbi:MAG: hypothetical protein GY838_01940 [bacterium]|nr:hypothetical protein [bacterium]
MSGTYTTGSVLTITGNGFGQKIPAEPHVWDNFENGAGSVGTTIGAPPVGVGRYAQIGTSVYTLADPYTGNVSLTSYENGGTGEDQGLITHWIPSEEKSAFASMKFKIISAAGTIAPNNIKLMRLNAALPDYAHGFPNFNIGNDRDRTTFPGIVNHGIQQQTYFGGFGTLPNIDQWNSMSMYTHMGDVNVANGFAGRSINGQVAESGNIMTLAPYEGYTDRVSGIRSVMLGSYVSYEGARVEVCLDDIYVDKTLARVVVYNPDGGNREMQIPAYWTNNEIRVEANFGRYASGTRLAMVVYDEDNNDSAPYTFFVGGDGTDLGAPGQPGTPILQ